MLKNETGARKSGKKVRINHRPRVRAPRRHVRLPARVQFAGGQVVGTVVNLSYTGILVQIDDELPVIGTGCEVIIELPDGRLRAKGKVSRLDAGSGRFGLDLTHLGRGAYLVLAALLSDVGTGGGGFRKARKL